MIENLCDSFLREDRIQVALRDIENGLMWRQRLTGHPFGQAVVGCREAGATVELAFQPQRLPPQRLEDVRAHIPAVARVEQITDDAGRRGETEPGKDAGAQRVVARHVELRVAREGDLNRGIEMIHLGADGQPGGVIRTLGRGGVGDAGTLDGPRIVRGDGLPLTTGTRVTPSARPAEAAPLPSARPSGVP